MNAIKQLFNQLCKIVDKKFQEMNEKDNQKKQQLAEQHRKNIETSKGVELRKRWAFALNSLPAHMRISCNEIDSYSLSNFYENSHWELQVSVQDFFSKSKCKGVQELLTEILNNQFQETRQEFMQKIFNDSNEYAEQKVLVKNNQPRTKEDFFFISNYKKFFTANYYRLIIVEIIDIECIENKLHIQYKIDESIYQYFHYENYWRLIGC